MIAFWTTDAVNRITIDTYRKRRGLAVADRFVPRNYDEGRRPLRVHAGPQIFTSLEHATDAQLAVAARIWDAHARLAPDAVRLNDPRCALRRFDMLRTLHQQGVNHYQAWRAAEYEAVDRFPVFVRGEADHGGPRSGLLHSHDAIARAIGKLRMRGWRLDELIVIEFCDTSDRDGTFRKYAAFNIGGRILPCHAMAAYGWNVKSGGVALDAAVLNRELDFIETNPHEPTLRRAFEIAGIDYGRVDYGVSNGVVQVWEINLNPTLGRLESRHRSLPPAVKVLQQRVRETFYERLAAAFTAIDRPDDGRVADVEIEPALRGRLRREALVRQPRTWIHRRVLDAYLHPTLGRQVRTAYRRLFRRGA